MELDEDCSALILSTIPTLRDFASREYESDNYNVKALCTLISMQLDLFESALILMRSLDTQGLVSICVIARSLIENEGTIRHISGHPKRGKAYIEYLAEINTDIASYVENRTPRPINKMWSSSKIKHRVALLSPGSIIAYDFLSNFVHGNNIHLFQAKYSRQTLKLVGVVLIPNFADLMLQTAKTLPLSHTEKSILNNKIREIHDMNTVTLT